VRFAVPIVLALLLSALAYQIPIRTQIDVGQLGDQLFLPSSQAQDAAQIERGTWYADEISPVEIGGRSRWSRENATIVFPGLGQGRDLDLTFYAKGWPNDTIGTTVDQPTINVRVGNQTVGSFDPTGDLAPHTITIPADAVIDPLTIRLESTATFTDTQQFVDRRPKAIRLDTIAIATGGWGTIPDWRVVGGVALAAALAMGATANRSRRPWLPIAIGCGVALLGATLVATVRLWLAVLLPSALIALLLLLALAYKNPILGFLRGLLWRARQTRALDRGLIGALLTLMAYLLLRLIVRVPPLPADATSTSDRWLPLLVRLSLVSLIAMVLVASVTSLPRGVLALRRALLTGRTSAIVLGVVAGIWIGYEAWLIATLPFVGHADYADNAVVARNLLRGRGWVVDYVTQFYHLVPNGGVTRVQETWPLLQPVLMLPSMALLGPTPFAARLPNIVFLSALTIMIYHIGSRVWDRRVGLLAAVLTITNLLFFRLAIYATSDLALVVWSMAAIYLFWIADFGFWIREAKQQTKIDVQLSRRFGFGRLQSKIQNPKSKIVLAGLFTGLMILQKPSAAIFAIGMGLWALWRIERRRREAGSGFGEMARRWWPGLVLWTGITMLVVSPFIVRNLVTFGRLFYSTEAYDAWVLFFRGTAQEAWEEIYRVYAAPLSASGLPNRSWVLRWGWDLTLDKIAQQARDAWDFFAPPRGRLLTGEGNVGTSIGIVATWLFLMGLVTLRPRQRTLIGLVASAVVLYTAFLIVYWHTHDEPRYFVPFVPWMALVVAWGACWLFDRIASIANGRWAGLGGLTVSMALVASIYPHYVQADRFLDPKGQNYWGRIWQADIEVFEWLRDNTPPDAVVMSRVPWQLNYHADRSAIMIPNAPLDQIMQIARYYDVDYLVVRAGSTSQPERVGVFDRWRNGDAPDGWELVHEVSDDFDRTVRIYRFPPDYDDAPPIDLSAAASEE
jgi:hypothetical protein